MYAKRQRIKIDTCLDYRDGEVFIKRLVTNEIPALLTFELIESLKNTIVKYFNELDNEPKRPEENM